MLNADKPKLWNEDTKRSVLQYNEWFMDFAPQAFRQVRNGCLESASELFAQSDNLQSLSSDLLLKSPSMMSVLRVLCAPPIAVDRLSGLAGVPNGRIKNMEAGKLPRNKKVMAQFIDVELPSLIKVISRLMDKQLLSWLDGDTNPSDMDLLVAKSVIADRLCGNTSDPIIRNEQEARQLRKISAFLNGKGYRRIEDAAVTAFDMPNGTYAFHKKVQMYKNAEDSSDGFVNTPIDVVIMPMDATIDKPVLVECKSAGDYTNTNKRRKEEETKASQLRATYGKDTTLYLFLSGYFNSGYLGFEAAALMDWVWEHRIEDFEGIGI